MAFKELENVDIATANQLSDTPWLGYAPPLEKQRLENDLKKSEFFKGAKLEFGSWNWVKKNKKINNHFIFNFTCSNLIGNVYAGLPKQDAINFTNLCINEQAANDPEIVQATIDFALAELVKIFRGQKCFAPFSWSTEQIEDLKIQDFWTTTVNLQIEDQLFCFDLLLDLEFIESWRSFWKSQPQISLAKSTLEIPLNVHLQINQAELSHAELKSLKPGDFIVLNDGTWDLQKSPVKLYLDQQLVAKGEIKGRELVIHEKFSLVS